MHTVQEWLKTKHPTLLDYDANNIGEDMNSNVCLVKEHFTETYFSFVTETVFESTRCRCLLQKNIYVLSESYIHLLLQAGLGCLRYLKEQGYETFPELFDESL